MALATVQQCENNVASDISQMQGWCERAQDHNNRQALDLNLLSLVAADSAIVNSKVESLLFGIITPWVIKRLRGLWTFATCPPGRPGGSNTARSSWDGPRSTVR